MLPHTAIRWAKRPRSQSNNTGDQTLRPSSRKPFSIHNSSTPYKSIELVYYSVYMVPCPVLPPPPPPHGMGRPPPPPIPHAFCTRHCSETYISILLHARRCSETHIFILLDEPSRRIRWVDRAKLWRNANFKLQEWLRAVYRTLQCSANGIIYIYISMYIHIHKHQ